MTFLKQLSIRNKLLFILAIVVVLQLLVSLTCVYLLRSVNDRLDHVAEVDAGRIKLAGYINSDLLEIHRAQKNLILALNPDDVERFRRHLSQYRTVLQDDLAGLERLADEEDRVMIREFKIPYAQFLKVNDEAERLVLEEWEASPGEGPAREINRKAIELSMARGREAYDNASRILSDLMKRTDASLDQAQATSRRYLLIAFLTVFGLSSVSILIAVSVGLYVARSISGNINSMVKVAGSIAAGDLDTEVQVEEGDETGKLAASIREMQAALRRARDEFNERDWLKTGIARLNDAMHGRVDVSDLCAHVIRETATYLDARIGAVFVLDGEQSTPALSLAGKYAYSYAGESFERFKPGVGLVGQAALGSEPMVVHSIPEDYIKVSCALGDTCPKSLVLSPFLFDGKVKGVVELGFLKEPSELELEYLRQVMPAVGINVETARSREALAGALARSQALAEELQTQQEELRQMNQVLEEQTQKLERSQQRLEIQQRELEETNLHLERRKQDIEETNKALETSRMEAEESARRLAAASKYKSEFLANMSHELRTPLNSMLLLALLLAENKEGNLTPEQVKSAQIIHGSGEDLLSLINQILDLSRVEAGRVDIEARPVGIVELAESVRKGFEHVAREKDLLLDVTVSEGSPARIETDRLRLEQILRNLVSNAVKFTEKGSVQVRFGRPADGRTGLFGEDALEISVIDTGIGIPVDKREIIFEAFRQAEGGTARKYGGTGLGLAISRKLARLLGGEIEVESEEGAGSTFTVTLPSRSARKEAEKLPLLPARPYTSDDGRSPAPAALIAPAVPALSDDRDTMNGGDSAILIIEDDPGFAGALANLCRERGYKRLVSATGEEGLDLAARFAPKGILLDIRLPGMDGWSVLEHLKDNPDLRHIPVHIISVMEEESEDASRRGAVGFLLKPASREDLDAVFHKLEALFNRDVRRLLVVEDEEATREHIARLLADGMDVEVDEAGNGEEAVAALQTGRYDCMILDLGLPDMNGLEVIRRVQADEGAVLPPVIVYTARELTREEEYEIRGCTESVILKGERSRERLLDEASLFMHRAIEKMPEKQRRVILDLHDPDVMFRGKRVLIVDDDMRNVFALARVLEEKGVQTIKAENGERALEMLETHPDMDLVLMDIMMPVLDGYETMRRIRAREEFRKLPVLALTAKAMQGDRERCIEAGANDYLKKPVDVKRLLSLMRVWMYR